MLRMWSRSLCRARHKGSKVLACQVSGQEHNGNAFPPFVAQGVYVQGGQEAVQASAQAFGMPYMSSARSGSAGGQRTKLTSA